MLRVVGNAVRVVVPDEVEPEARRGRTARSTPQRSASTWLKRRRRPVVASRSGATPSTSPDCPGTSKSLIPGIRRTRRTTRSAGGTLPAAPGSPERPAETLTPVTVSGRRPTSVWFMKMFFTFTALDAGERVPVLDDVVAPVRPARVIRMGVEERVAEPEVIRLLRARPAVRRAAVAHETPREIRAVPEDHVVDLDRVADDLRLDVLHAAGQAVARRTTTAQNVETVDRVRRCRCTRNAKSK